VGAFLQELFQFGVYKRTQGRIARQVTFAACALLVAMGCWQLSEELHGYGSEGIRLGIPLLLLAAGVWACFRLVQLPQFADFLISVESEMNKVAWPKRRELINASIVVIVVIFLLATMLFTFDLLLQSVPWVFRQVVNFFAGTGTEVTAE